MNDVVLNVWSYGDLEYIFNIDEYIEVKRTDNFYNHSFLEISLPLNEKTLSFLSVGIKNPTPYTRCITVSDEPEKVYFTQAPQLFLGSEPYIYIMCYSMSAIFSFRVNEMQKEFTNTDYSVAVQSLVNRNAIASPDYERNFSNLVFNRKNLGQNYNGLITRGRKLDNQLTILLNNIEASWDIIRNDNNVLELVLIKGKDYTIDNFEGNIPIIMSYDNDNIISSEYLDDRTGYFNSFYTLGKGDNEKEFFLKDDNGISGFQRREAFIENSETKQTFNDGSRDVTIPDATYRELLTNYARSEMVEFKRIRSITTEINDNGRYSYLKDYKLGDKLTVKLDYLNLYFDAMVATVTTTYNKDGRTREIEFGESTLTQIQAIRKGLNNGTKK